MGDRPYSLGSNSGLDPAQSPTAAGRSNDPNAKYLYYIPLASFVDVHVQPQCTYIEHCGMTRTYNYVAYDRRAFSQQLGAARSLFLQSFLKEHPHISPSSYITLHIRTMSWVSN